MNAHSAPHGDGSQSPLDLSDESDDFFEVASNDQSGLSCSPELIEIAIESEKIQAKSTIRMRLEALYTSRQLRRHDVSQLRTFADKLDHFSETGINSSENRARFSEISSFFLEAIVSQDRIFNETLDKFMPFFSKITKNATALIRALERFNRAMEYRACVSKNILLCLKPFRMEGRYSKLSKLIKNQRSKLKSFNQSITKLTTIFDNPDTDASCLAKFLSENALLNDISRYGSSLRRYNRKVSSLLETCSGVQNYLGRNLEQIKDLETLQSDLKCLLQPLKIFTRQFSPDTRLGWDNFKQMILSDVSSSMRGRPITMP